MKYFIYKNVHQEVFAVFCLESVNKRFFMKIKKNEKPKYIVVINSKQFQKVLPSEIRELVEDFDNKTFNTYNSFQSIPKALQGFSYGEENGVPLAYMHWNDHEGCPSFTNGRTRTAFLLNNKLPSFPTSTDAKSVDKMMAKHLIDLSFGIVRAEDLFEPTSEVYKNWCAGFREEDYVSPDPKSRALYLKHKKLLERSTS